MDKPWSAVPGIDGRGLGYAGTTVSRVPDNWGLRCAGSECWEQGSGDGGRAGQAGGAPGETSPMSSFLPCKRRGKEAHQRLLSACRLFPPPPASQRVLRNDLSPSSCCSRVRYIRAACGEKAKVALFFKHTHTHHSHTKRTRQALDVLHTLRRLIYCSQSQRNRQNRSHPLHAGLRL